MSEDATCHCDDPRGTGFKLWLCGSALCRAIMEKNSRNGHAVLNDGVKRTIVIGEEQK